LMMNNCWRMNEHTTYNNEKKGWSNKDENGNRNLGDAYREKAGRSQQEKGGRPEVDRSGRVEVERGGRPEVERGGRPEVDRGGRAERPQSAIQAPTNSAFEKFKNKLLSRGAKGIIGIQRQFKIFDDDNSKTIDLDEFTKAVKDFKVDLTPNEIKVVFGCFDRDGQGSIDYDEFIRTVRGEMNDRRKRLAMKAFEKLDRDGSGILEINDIKYIYNAKMHPDVKSGKKTEEDVFGEFLETFETHHNILKGNRDRRITKDEWLEYYNNVSASIDDDNYFEVMMTNAWKLNGNTTYAKGWSGDYSDKKEGARGAASKQVYQNAPFGVSEGKTNYSTSNKQESAPKKNNFSNKGDDVLVKFREKISSRGTRGIFGIRRSFMIADDNNSKSIDFAEFKKLIKDYRYEINDGDIKKLFNIFDSNENGEIDYDEFLRSIVGEMNDFRRGLAKRAFAKMDKNGNGKLEVDDIRGVYNAKFHPDVKSGKKTEDEVLAEFLDNFEYHFSLLVFNFLFLFP
jgi:calcyphosin